MTRSHETDLDYNVFESQTEMIKVTVRPGARVRDAIRQAVLLQRRSGKVICFNFNGTHFEVTSKSTEEQLLKSFWAPG